MNAIPLAVGAVVLPRTLASSSVPAAGRATWIPLACHAPEPFFPWEMKTAGRAEPIGVAWDTVRVNTATSPREHSAKDDCVGAGRTGPGVAGQVGDCLSGLLMAGVPCGGGVNVPGTVAPRGPHDCQVFRAIPSANAGATR